MPRISTYTRLSLGLVFLTVSALICAYLLGLIPDQQQFVLAERQAISESLAVLCSKAAAREDFETIDATIKALVDRNTQILSAALRKADGTMPAMAGDHRSAWKDALISKSSPTHVRVPIYQGDQIWGHVEVAFRPMFGEGINRFLHNPILRLLGFVLLLGFILYRLFLAKVLRQLDPTSVVPPRVRMALDTMVEGIVMLDNNGRIILANEVFSKKVVKTETQLTGRRIDSFNWETASGTGAGRKFPWKDTLENNSRQAGIPLRLSDEDGKQKIFMVNTSPIIDSTGKSRGALVTFDDVTDVEDKNRQLKTMVEKLETSSQQIALQNKKLEYLATRDPLTGCLNRRSFFEIFDKEFNTSKRYGHPVSCIMFDIDHFKSINDNHGHAAGDDVLRNLSAIIRSLVRDTDTVGRYGGEEFCIILPHSDLDQAAQAAERFRAAVQAHDFSGIPVAASFGVSSIEFKAKDPSALIDQADKALYVAKESGRNRVVTYKHIASKLETASAPTPGIASVQKAATPTQDVEGWVPNPRPAPALQAKSDWTEGDENGNGRQEALRLVHTSLAESAQQSETSGLHAASMKEDPSVVQLNKAPGWGDAPAKVLKRNVQGALSASRVAEALRVNTKS